MVMGKKGWKGGHDGWDDGMMDLKGDYGLGAERWAVRFGMDWCVCKS